MEKKQIIYILILIVLIGMLSYQVYYIFQLNNSLGDLSEQVSELKTEQVKINESIEIAQEQIKNISKERDILSTKYQELEKELKPYQNG